MLVLSRKPEERIQIGDDIMITLVRIAGAHSIRIGIEAPKELNIRRLDPIQYENVIINGTVVRRLVETPEDLATAKPPTRIAETDND